MKVNIVILFCCVVLFLFSTNSFTQDLNSNTNVDTLNSSEVINQLKLDLINKDIEIAKTDRTLGWVIAAPTAAYTFVSLTAAILYPLHSNDADWIPIILTTAASTILAYIGFDMIWTANYKIDKYEKKLIEYSGQPIQTSNNFKIVNLRFRL